MARPGPKLLSHFFSSFFRQNDTHPTPQCSLLCGHVTRLGARRGHECYSGGVTPRALDYFEKPGLWPGSRLATGQMLHLVLCKQDRYTLYQPRRAPRSERAPSSKRMSSNIVVNVHRKSSAPERRAAARRAPRPCPPPAPAPRTCSAHPRCSALLAPEPRRYAVYLMYRDTAVRQQRYS